MTDMPLLRTQGLTKRFGGLVAVDGVSLEVREGEAVGIIGPNGAGKTTLFSLIGGFEQPSAGRVAFRGEDVTGQPPHALARKGLVRTFQIVRPFPGLTVLQNLLVGGFSNRVFDTGREVEEARERALQVASQTGLLPWLHRAAETLPHGSLKRLEVARAMMLKPQLLLLDEPFAGLGGHEVEEVGALVAELCAQGLTLLIIEHKLRVLMRLVRRVVVLHFGRQIADGTPQEVAESPAVQEAYLGKGAVHLA